MRMNVLSPEVKLPPRLDRLTNPDLDLCRVERIVPMAGGALLVGFERQRGRGASAVEAGGKTALAHWRVRWGGGSLARRAGGGDRAVGRGVVAAGTGRPEGKAG